MTIAEKYQAERDTLEIGRSMDWSSYDIDYIVAGEKLEPMTVGTWFDLLIVKSPIVTNENITIESIVDYVWRNSKKRTNNIILKQWRLFWIDRKITQNLKNEQSADQLVKVLKEHVKMSFTEVPDGSTESPSGYTNKMKEFCGEAAMVDEIAHRYSMNPMDVLKMPLRQAFALQRVIRMSTIPNYQLLEPSSLRSVKSEFLKHINNVERN